MKIKKTKNRFLALFINFTLVIGMCCGCGSSGSGESQVLNVCIWDGMFSEDAIDQFEEEFDVTVNVTYIDNTDTMISKLINGESDYDVCDIEAAYVKTFVDSGLLQEMDHSAIPNEEYVEENLMAEGPVGDEDFTYVTPDCNAGYTTIIYNVDTCPIEIDSFDDLADPALEGEVAMVSSTISIYGGALEALGYSAATTNEDEIAEANELLTDIKKNVKTFVSESAVSALVNNECSVAYCWDYAVLCFDSEEYWDQFAIAEIDSDYEKFVQYWGITSNCENTELATEFINYMISPEAVAMHIDEWGQIPMVQREYIEEYLPEGFYDNPCIEVYEELADKSWMVSVNDDQISLMDTYYTLLMGGN